MSARSELLGTLRPGFSFGLGDQDDHQTVCILAERDDQVLLKGGGRDGWWSRAELAEVIATASGPKPPASAYTPTGPLHKVELAADWLRFTAALQAQGKRTGADVLAAKQQLLAEVRALLPTQEGQAHA